MSISRKQYDTLVGRINFLSREVVRLTQVLYSTRAILKWVVKSNNLGAADMMPLEGVYAGEVPPELIPEEVLPFSGVTSYVVKPKHIQTPSLSDLIDDIFIGEDYEYEA